MRNNSEVKSNREKVIVRTSVVGILTNILLSAGKAIVGILANSIAVVLDSVNNLSDALSSIITIVGTKLASKPATKKHPFGFGRIEYISSFIISVIILYAGFTSFVESVKKIVRPTTPDYSLLSVVLIGSAVVVKIVLGLFVKAQGKKANSTSLVASGQDALLDSIVSFSTLVAAIVFRFTGFALEAYLGIIISVLIVKSGFELVLETVSQILGERIDGKLAKEIKRTVASVDEEIFGAYDLSLNNYGPEKLLGSVHIEVPESWSAEKIDTVTRKIQAAVYEKHGVLISAVGVYSRNSETSETAKMKEKVDEIASSHPDILQTHGFYVDFEYKRMVFDAVVAFSKEHKLKFEAFEKDVKEAFPGYEIHVQMDIDVSD